MRRFLNWPDPPTASQWCWNVPRSRLPTFLTLAGMIHRLCVPSQSDRAGCDTIRFTERGTVLPPRKILEKLGRALSLKIGILTPERTGSIHALRNQSGRSLTERLSRIGNPSLGDARRLAAGCVAGTINQHRRSVESYPNRANCCSRYLYYQP